MGDSRVPIRVASLALTNFRSFRERTLIDLRRNHAAEEEVVFHGDNGSGKSTALRALAVFFSAVLAWCRWRPGNALPSFILSQHDGASLKNLVTHRDWAPGGPQDAKMQIEVEFGSSDLARLELAFARVGNDISMELKWSESSKPVQGEQCETIRRKLEAPFGPGSTPFVILNARRRGDWLGQQSNGSSDKTLPGSLAERLYALRTSLDTEERERWRQLTELLGRFPSIAGKEITVERPADKATAHLVFEERRRQVLALEDLSSGEQQIATLCATVLASRAAIVAIEEPEISLSRENQEKLRGILYEQLKLGRIDQLLLESHVYAFDGPEVVRFKRNPDGSTTATRVRTVVDEQRTAIEEKAKEQGAQKTWVTSGGYTQLPETMIKDLGIDQGGDLWFLKGSRPHWEAWPEPEVDAYFGGDSDKGGKKP